jgi:hypothetical protein
MGAKLIFMLSRSITALPPSVDTRHFVDPLVTLTDLTFCSLAWFLFCPGLLFPLLSASCFATNRLMNKVRFATA